MTKTTLLGLHRCSALLSRISVSVIRMLDMRFCFGFRVSDFEFLPRPMPGYTAFQDRETLFGPPTRLLLIFSLVLFPLLTLAQESQQNLDSQDQEATTTDKKAEDTKADTQELEFAKSPAAKPPSGEPAARQPAGKQPTLPPAWVNVLKWRSIGPANMSGRVPALAVYERDPNIWWVASASGGLVKTVNNGTTFEHQFDHEATVSIGDVQVASSDANIVWVGTGEANPRNSVSWGDGVYKSTDGGKTWKNMGLKNSFQIGRIAIHPTDPNIVYVGALGRLWGPNEDRGLYKTTDGGETWTKILFVDDKTGVIDVQMNLKNPDTLLVATYQRQRDGFDGNDPAKKFGPGSGVYLTKNGGETFQRVVQGLPEGNLGRIGISIYRKDPRNVYLVLESEKIGQVPENAGYAGLRGEDADVGARLLDVVAKSPAEAAGLQKGDIVIGVNGKTIHSYNEFVKEIDARQTGDKLKLSLSRDRKTVHVELELGKVPQSKQLPRQRRQSEPTTPQEQARAGSKFAQSLGGQQANQLQGPDGHQYGGIYQSKDGGETWTRVNSLNPRPMYYSQIRVDPTNKKNIWVLGTRLYLSKDGGATFSSENTARNIHVDHHSMWINPRDGRHVLLGNDGGIHITYDQGLNWDHLNHVAIGQFYHVVVGPRRDYSVYGGLQDNGSWGAPQRGGDGRGAVSTDWISIGGGDGFVCAVDPEDPDLIYSESQGGAIGRINLRTGERSSVRPRAERGVRYRFNWKTPFLLSPHNSKIFYSAGNHVFRSPYKGNNLQAISPDITLTKEGTASALSESPAEEGVLYVGTTDGAIWITKDGGHVWTNLYGKPADQKAPEAKRAQEAETEPSHPTQQSDEAEPQTTEPAKEEPVQEESVKEETAEDVSGKEEPAHEEPAEPAAESESPAVKEDLVSGTWEGQFESENMPADRAKLTVVLRMDLQGKITGSLRSTRSAGNGTGKFNPETKEVSFSVETERATIDVTGTVSGTDMRGTVDVNRGDFSIPFSAKRTGDAPAVDSTAEKPKEVAPPGKPLQDLLPGPRWFSSIEASHFQRGRVYITCDAHRSNDDRPYVFVSEDYGQTWRSLLANLPETVGSSRVIREDLKNQNVLYLGTEFSLWVSVDRGESWTGLNSNLPTVAVHEVAVHPTAGEIVAATHGRSLWILDVAALRQLTAETIAADAYLYAPQPAIQWRSRPSRGSSGTRQFTGDAPPNGAAVYYSLARDAGTVSIKITDIEGKTVRQLEGVPQAGLHRVQWDLRRAPRPSPPRQGPPRGGGPVDAGKYLVTLTVDDTELKQVLVVVDDPTPPASGR